MDRQMRKLSQYVSRRKQGMEGGGPAGMVERLSATMHIGDLTAGGT